MIFFLICFFSCLLYYLFQKIFQTSQSIQYIPVATTIDPSNTYPSAPPMNPPILPMGGSNGGYWSGMGTGGLLGYMFGRSSRGSSWGSNSYNHYGGGGFHSHNRIGSSNNSIPMTRQTGYARTQRR